jgi:hypothetical protein
MCGIVHIRFCFNIVQSVQNHNLCSEFDRVLLCGELTVLAKNVIRGGNIDQLLYGAKMSTIGDRMLEN